MGITQPTLSRVLNGKVGGSDNFFRRIGESLGLSDREMSKIFRKGDNEEYFYNYWTYPGDTNSTEIDELDESQLLDVMFKRKGHTVSEQDKKTILSLNLPLISRSTFSSI